MNQKVSCIIPFYNEGNRILEVLKVVSQIKLVDEIICVDDGSVDSAYEDIKKTYPKVHLLKLVRNQGKAAAVKKGLSVAKSENILLLDADLIGLKSSEIEKAIKHFLTHPELDLLILYKRNDHFIARVMRWNVVIGGDRLIRKKYLKELYKQSINRYQLEVAMNHYFMSHKLNTPAFPMSHKYHFMTAKYGFFKGMWGELKLIRSMFSLIGPWEFIYQVLFFAR